MKKTVSGSSLLLAILKKDFRQYSRNMIYIFLTVLSLVFFVAIYWLVPDTVEEDLTFAITPPLDIMLEESRDVLLSHGIPLEVLAEMEELEGAFEEEGMSLIQFDSAEDLKSAILGELEVYRTEQQQYIFYDPAGDQEKPDGAKKISVNMGLSFPTTFLSDAALDQKPVVSLYADAAVPRETRNALEGFVRELAYEISGHGLPVEMPEEEIIILGEDRLGDQISMQEKMRPLIAFFIMMMETFALASLISNEVLQRTVTALLVTPVRVWHFLFAKTIFGTILAMGQAVIILLLVGAFDSSNWLLLLVTVLMGSLLFTAVAMFVGSAGKDFIGQLMFSMLFIIPLMIPAFAVLFPGSVAAWVSFLPSYPIVRLLYDITVYNVLWEDIVSLIFYALIWTLIIYGAGLFVLKRKVATL